MSAAPLLEVDAVSMRFAGLEALRGVTFAVARGETAAIIGPNGAGKTTLLNVIAGSLRPTAGVVRLRGTRITGRPPHRVTAAGIGRTFQNLELFGGLTVIENVMAGGAAQSGIGIVAAMLAAPGTSTRRRDLVRRAEAQLALVGLADRRDDQAAALPAGQRRLLAVARTLATGAELLILDEPGAGLNAVEKDALADVISRLPGEGKTVLFVEHDMGLVGRLAERVVVLDRGEKIADGPPAAIRENPRVVTAYLGVRRGAERGEAATTPEPGAAPLLEVRDLHVAYAGVRALVDVSVEVRPREIVALVGANGAGKTTLLHAVTGMVRPHRGAIRFGGDDITAWRPETIVRAGVSLVPEGRQLFPSLSVWDNLALGRYGRVAGSGTWLAALRPRPGRAREIADAADQVFALFPVLRERRAQLAGTLSGGEGQMLAIGRALMASPRLLMLDEPSLGLGPRVVDEIMERLVALRAAGLTILLVEQNARAALEIADRGCVFETGRVAAAGDAAALLTDPEITRAYLGRQTDRMRGEAPTS